MGIPKKISIEHIRCALREIDNTGIPRNRTYDRYYLFEGGLRYPVKYVISVAHKFYDPKQIPLAPNTFDTYDAQKFLKYLGFNIIDDLNDCADKSQGFKLLSLELIDNPILGTISYTFVEEKDKQSNIYTTVIIGPNGTGKSILFRIVIELFRELYGIIEGHPRTYAVSGQFALKYALNGDIYSFTNIVGLALARRIHEKNSKNYYYITKNGEVIADIKVPLPANIVANSIMLTDKYPLYPNDSVFPNYKYLGVRNNAQNASTRSYVRRTVDYIIAEKDSSAFRNGLEKITEFLGMRKSIEVYYTTINAPTFFNGEITIATFERYFDKLQEKYEESEYPPQKLNNYLKLTKNDVNELCEFCNNLFHEQRLQRIKKGSSVRKISYNITDEDSFQQLKNQSEKLERLRQIGLLYSPEIYLSRYGNYSLQESSSGEYHFFSSMVALMATVKMNSLIFLDEPEISLHPNWQMNYVSFVRKLFSDPNYNTSHILIATHSHFLVSDLNGEDSKIIGLKRSSGKNHIKVVDLPKNMDTYGWSAEDVLYNVFDVLTIRNKYVANVIGDILEELSVGSKNKTNVLDRDRLELLLHLNKNLKDIDPLKKVVESILQKIG